MGKELLWGVLALTLVVATCFYTLLVVGELPDRGTFGDMFGAANALFSGLALTGLIVTLVVQQKEFRLQRESLSNSNQELDAQKRLMAQSAFDTTFFKMIELHERNVREMGSNRNKDSSQENNFHYFIEKFQIALEEHVSGIAETDLTAVAQAYDQVYKDYGHLVSYYFRSLHNLIHFIQNSTLACEMRGCSASAEETINPYMKILRSLFTPEQRHILFLNTIARDQSSSESQKKLGESIVNQRLLKHFNLHTVKYFTDGLNETDRATIRRIVGG